LIKTIYITLILGILISCKQEKEPNQAENKPTGIPAWKIDLDTILERNNPKSLDLMKHQLFIDTTRNSEIYKKIISWKLNRSDNDAISYYEKEISKKYKPIKVDLKDFPRHWISLKKLNNEFVIYEPCDGQTPSYAINETSIVFVHQLEGDADLISKLKKLSGNEIEVELNTIPQKTKSEKAELTIKPTEFENVYELTYSFDNVMSKQFVTPNNKASEFDIIVNHCPKRKRMEFNGFDKD
jgi:hypothetical protein